MKKLVNCLALFAVLAFPAIAAAQSDPCSVYPKNYAPIVEGTPTSAPVTGSANQSIYVCGVHVNLTGSSPQVIFSHGEASGGTPCATSTASNAPSQLLTLGGPAFGPSEVNVGNDNATLWVIPANAATPYEDLCVLTTTGGSVTGTITYVKKKP